MEKLTHAEEQTMQAVWQTGEGNIKSFMESMDNPPPYTTVASTIKNLEKKGYVTSRKIGNMYQYMPIVDEAEYKKNFLTNMVKNHFANSYKELVSFFAEEKKISPKELKEIIEIIEKKGRK